jgi:hypothetical protein
MVVFETGDQRALLSWAHCYIVTHYDSLYQNSGAQLMRNIIFLALMLAGCPNTTKPIEPPQPANTPVPASLPAQEAEPTPIAADPKTAAVVSKSGTPSLVVKTDCVSKKCLKAQVNVLVANNGFGQPLNESGDSLFFDLPSGEASVSVRYEDDPSHPMYGEAKITLPLFTKDISINVANLDASASITGVLVDEKGKPADSRRGGQLVVEASCKGFNRRVTAATNGDFTVENVIPGECDVTGLRIDPKDPMSGQNGLRSLTKVVAPATKVKVLVNDFFRP